MGLFTKMSRSGVCVKDVSAHEFVVAYGQYLKRTGKIEVPKWADLVKTGTLKELAPYDPDWFYYRTASIARKVYLRNGLGVGSGSIARAALQQLEQLKVVENTVTGGRKITKVGQQDLDRIAGQIAPKQTSE